MTDERINELIAELMEPKPEATKTYKQLEEEDGGQYGCWSIYSPGARWEINIDWGRDRCRVDEIAKWTPSTEATESVEAAFEVEEKIKDLKLESAYVKCLIDIVSQENESMFSLVHATPKQRCLAALKAKGVEIE